MITTRVFLKSFRLNLILRKGNGCKTPRLHYNSFMKRYDSLLSSDTSLTTFSPVPKGAESWLLAELLATAENRTLIYIAADGRELENIQQHLGFIAPNAEILTFPAWDCLPYDRVSPASHITAERVTTLSILARRPHAERIILTTPAAMLHVYRLL
jgi:transcription-repair coupling factor (superfamily II helicase)